MVDVLKELNPSGGPYVSWSIDRQTPYVTEVHDFFKNKPEEATKTIHQLHDAVRFDDATGARYVVIGGRQNGKATETAIMHTLAFGNSLKPITIARAFAFQQAVTKAGLRTPEGDEISLVAFAAPSGHSTYHMRPRNEKEPRLMPGIGFEDIALAQLGIARSIGIRRAVMTGVSMGGDVAISAGNLAAHRSLDVLGVAAVEPIRVKSQSSLKVMRNMLAEDISKYRAARKDTDVLQQMARAAGQIPSLLSVLRHPIVNVRIIRELANGSFMEEAQKLQEHSPTAAVTIGSGMCSQICPSKIVETQRISLTQPDKAKPIHHVRIMEGEHVWPEYYNLGPMFAVYGVARALAAK